MIRRLITFGFEQPWAIFLAWVVLVAAGVRAFLPPAVEPFPDPDDVHVNIVTMYPGKAAEEVETTITRPLERTINGVPGLTSLRSESMFGLSFIRTTFDDHTTDSFAHQQILERIAQANLPTGITPALSPYADSVGEVYRYTMNGPGVNVQELGAIDDWVVVPALLSIRGVADVNTMGGGRKQFVVQVDPALLRAYGVTLPQVFQAMQNSNANGGGAVVERGDQEYTIRSVGLYRTPREVEKVVVTQNAGTPVLVGDVAHVERGVAPRHGFVAIDDVSRDPALHQADIVDGVVVMRKGENAVSVCERIQKKIDELNKSGLPKGVQVRKHYDRSYLVWGTLKTLLDNSLFGLFLVFGILLFFLGGFRISLIVTVSIPLSVLFAITIMYWIGSPMNLFSLGAVDFGIVVEPSVIIAEAMYVAHLLKKEGEDRERKLLDTVLELGPPIFFASLIFITLKVPIFMFERVEGRIFRPLALMLALSFLGALLLALTLVPQLFVLFYRGNGGRGIVGRITLPAVDAMRRAYAAFLGWAIRWRWAVLSAVTVLFGLSLYGSARLGTEFLPRLEESNILLTATLPVSVATSESLDMRDTMRKIVAGPFDGPRNFPEVRQVIAELGNEEDGSEPKTINNLEMQIDLAPPEEWPVRDVHVKDEKSHSERVEHRRYTKEELIADMTDRLKVIPGVDYNFSQVIQDNVEEALSGVKGEVAVKILGPDVEKLQELGNRVRDVIKSVDGAADVECARQTGLPSICTSIDRDKAARAGINVSDIQSAIEQGVGSGVATTYVEPDRTFDVAVRLVRSARNTPERLRDVLLPTSDGSLVPIGEVADVKVLSGSMKIRREKNQRWIAVKFGIRERDLGSVVRDAQAAVDREVVHGTADGKAIWSDAYKISWEGEYENQQRAMSRLKLIVPACLLVIFGLLFFAFRSLRSATLVMATVPLSLMGGVLGLWWMGIYLSVNAALGFNILVGIVVADGIILFSKIHTYRDLEKMDIEQAIVRGCSDRLRPVLMTGITAALGFLPSILSHGMGAEVRRPLAAVVVFGTLLATLFTLVVMPCLYRVFETGPVKAPGLAHD